MTNTSKKLCTCKTVGALIKQLEKLPKAAKLGCALHPLFYNTGTTAKELGLKPQVLLEEVED